MKLKFTTLLLLLASLYMISCSKEETQDPSGEASDLFVRMRQGLIPGDDSVYLISYDANNRVKGLIDSGYAEMEATYDNAGNLALIVEKHDYNNITYNISFSYNEDNQLTQIYYETGARPEKYTFEYTNGVISRRSLYLQHTSQTGALELFRYYTYEVTDGNITNIKEYDYEDNLMSETKFTYTKEPNVFKSISLFRILGAWDIADFEQYFNKNLIATAVVTDYIGTPNEYSKTITYTYTYNDEKQLTKVVVTKPSYTYTWQLYY